MQTVAASAEYVPGAQLAHVSTLVCAVDPEYVRVRAGAAVGTDRSRIHRVRPGAAVAAVGADANLENSHYRGSPR